MILADPPTVRVLAAAPVRRRSRAMVRLPWRNPGPPPVGPAGGGGGGASRRGGGRRGAVVEFIRSGRWMAAGGTVAVHLALVGLALFWLVPVSVPAGPDEDGGLPLDIQCTTLAAQADAGAGQGARPRALPMLAAPAGSGSAIGPALEAADEELVVWTDSAAWPAPGSLTGGGFDGVPPDESGLGLQPARKAEAASARRQAGASAPAGPRIAPPRIVSAPPPVYPAAARAAGHEGVAAVRIAVKPDGSVAGVGLEQGTGHKNLDRAALEAARHWRFTPIQGLGRGDAMPVIVTVTFKR